MKTSSFSLVGLNTVRIIALFLCVGTLSPAQAADFSLNATAWVDEYSRLNNELAFDSKYKGKTLLLTGVVLAVTEGEITIGFDPLALMVEHSRVVVCRFLTSETAKATRLKRRDTVRMEGNYKGNKQLGYILVLEDCLILDGTSNQERNVSNTVSQESAATPRPKPTVAAPSDPSAVSLTAVCPEGKLGELHHGTKCTGFYDENELVDIVASGKTTSRDYVQTKSLVHAGVDLAAPAGSDVFPIADGIVDDVISSDKDPNFRKLGYLVLIKHNHKLGGKQTYSLYLHLRDRPPVGLGTAVKAGETIIGKVGKTGSAFGTHLHVEVRHFAGRLFEKWANIYGIERPSSESTFDETSFQMNWSYPEGLSVGRGLAHTRSVIRDRAEGNQDAAWAVIERAMEAMGGKEALSKMTRCRKKTQGTLTQAGSEPMSFTMDAYYNLPNKGRQLTVMKSKRGERSHVLVVYDGNQGWQRAASRVSNLSSGATAEMQSDLYCGDLLSVMASSDRAVFDVALSGNTDSGDQKLVCVRVASQGRPEVRLFFDKTTGLLTKQEQRMTVSGGKEVLEERVYREHKQFGGLSLATKLSVIRNGEDYAEISLTDVEPLTKISDSLFARP